MAPLVATGRSSLSWCKIISAGWLAGMRGLVGRWYWWGVAKCIIHDKKKQHGLGIALRYMKSVRLKKKAGIFKI